MFGTLSPTRLIGRSEAARFIENEINCAARSGAKVLITGETGAGKEVVARLIHQRSTRASNALVTVNCAGLPDGLLESELFGHQRGSFTGAYRDKPGRLEMAPNGTVFLDEVGEMSMRMQVILLRFLETGEIQRIGSDRPHTRVNVRLITATNRDLSKEIVAGTFREDLYFRLNVIRIHVPPLRERAEDVPLLIDYYLGVFCEQHRLPRPELAPATMEVLKHHQWPGNVRELKNVVERMVLRAGTGTVQVGDLPPHNFLSSSRPAAVAVAAPAAAAPAVQAQADAMMARMLQDGESFWNVVYPPFIGRDLTRAELQNIIRLGLEATNGNYRLLVQLFNMPLEDYKRFLGFLRKHDCHLPFQRFRTVPARLRPPSGAAAGAMATAG